MKGVTNMEKWIHIAYGKPEDGEIACKITSNISFYREKEVAFDMKVYVTGYRVYDLFNAKLGDSIHIDIYMSDGGESAGMEADFKVTEQGVEVVRATGVSATTAKIE
jgi:hypothetical protein